MDTVKREERLLSATSEDLDTERSLIQRAADKFAVDRSLGLLRDGESFSPREVIDWRVETFNRILEQRPELAIKPIDSGLLYAVADGRALARQQAAEEYVRTQWNVEPDRAEQVLATSQQPAVTPAEPVAERYASVERTLEISQEEGYSYAV